MSGVRWHCAGRRAPKAFHHGACSLSVCRPLGAVLRRSFGQRGSGGIDGRCTASSLRRKAIMENVLVAHGVCRALLDGLESRSTLLLSIRCRRERGIIARPTTLDRLSLRRQTASSSPLMDGRHYRVWRVSFPVSHGRVVGCSSRSGSSSRRGGIEVVGIMAFHLHRRACLPSNCTASSCFEIITAKCCRVGQWSRGLSRAAAAS